MTSEITRYLHQFTTHLSAPSTETYFTFYTVKCTILCLHRSRNHLQATYSEWWRLLRNWPFLLSSRELPWLSNSHLLSRCRVLDHRQWPEIYLWLTIGFNWFLIAHLQGCSCSMWIRRGHLYVWICGQTEYFDMNLRARNILFEQESLKERMRARVFTFLPYLCLWREDSRMIYPRHLV